MKHRLKRHLHHGEFSCVIIISAEHEQVVRATSEQNALSLTNRARRCIRCLARCSVLRLWHVAASYRNLNDRMRECTKVDVSLLDSSKCIDALSKSRTRRVSYRGSKLTHNFKDSLGDSRLGFMIVAVTPSKVSYLEACNTLNYAERAVQMKPQANKNVLNANGHISVYSALIEDYKEEVEGLQVTCEKTETENTAPETEVGELNNGLALMKASRNALLRAQETGGGDSGQARCNDALHLRRMCEVDAAKEPEHIEPPPAYVSYHSNFSNRLPDVQQEPVTACNSIPPAPKQAQLVRHSSRRDQRSPLSPLCGTAFVLRVGGTLTAFFERF
ncbi:hypothetical protein HPB49_005940 [Dermacentor silvarum]|uniref:Uncharacterized protein n=1 Tax=Dermacentor silvarum TaxID=543639 RepID=A0ACB8DWC7_DERSI|nr:hypothetical protein HPB49_005940 [Dermacentor silvarum]